MHAKINLQDQDQYSELQDQDWDSKSRDQGQDSKVRDQDWNKTLNIVCQDQDLILDISKPARCCFCCDVIIEVFWEWTLEQWSWWC